MELTVVLDHAAWNLQSYWTMLHGTYSRIGLCSMEPTVVLDHAAWNLQSYWTMLHGTYSRIGLYKLDVKNKLIVLPIKNKIFRLVH